MSGPEPRTVPERPGPAGARVPQQGLNGLARVSPDAPAAVLVVDLPGRQVIHANGVAQQMAPGVDLPVPVDAWARAAELRDIDGAELTDTSHPLSRVARSEPVAGQAVSAGRSTEMGRRREPLWVVGLPMDDAPVLSDHALVVFLPVRDRDQARAAADAATTDVELREAAVLATGLSFTVADARADDTPLVWVNPAFTAVTGYTFEESVGRNCRFLQGPFTDRASTAELRAAVAEGRDVTTTLLNHRKDGTAFWNQLAVSPIRDSTGAVTHFVGIQTDVTGQVAAAAERDRALAAERSARLEADAARADAEAAHARLQLLAEASAQLSRTLDAREAVQRLADVVVPALGDFCMVSLIADDAAPGGAGGAGASRTSALRTLHDVAWSHRDADQVPLLARLAEVRLTSLTSGSGVSRAYTSGEPAVLNHGAGDAIRSVMSDDEAIGIVERLAPEATAILPLRGRGRTLGVLSVWRCADRGPFTEDEVALGVDLSARAGLALDSARLYRQQRDLAAGLQRSLLTLTTIPRADHLEIAVRYVAAAEAAQVGGDWYDTFLQPGGGTVVLLGDVVGHDTQAAAAMSQVRSIARTIGAIGDDGPAALLAKTDQVMSTLAVDTTATAVAARLERPVPEGVDPAQVGDEGQAGDEGRPPTVLRWSSAGHPPAMLVAPGGAVSPLEGRKRDILLGVAPLLPRHESTVELEPGSTLVFYSDGLVERRDQPLQAGLTRLRETLTDLAGAGLPLEQLCDEVLERMVPARAEDDVALVAVRLHPEDGPRPDGAAGTEDADDASDAAGAP